jgi:outer membrane protein assembly factor BamB
VGHYEKEFVCVDLEQGQIAWTYKDEEHAAPFLSSPALTADRVVFGGQDKRLHCADRKTGERLWVFQTGGDVDGSPVVCGDKVVVGSADGKLYVVNLADGKEIWSYEINQTNLQHKSYSYKTVKAKMYPGSIRANIQRIAKQHGWKTVVWKSSDDYNWHGTAVVEGSSLADVMEKILLDYPLQADFYQGNHVLVIQPRTLK